MGHAFGNVNEIFQFPSEIWLRISLAFYMKLHASRGPQWLHKVVVVLLQKIKEGNKD